MKPVMRKLIVIGLFLLTSLSLRFTTININRINLNPVPDLEAPTVSQRETKLNRSKSLDAETLKPTDISTSSVKSVCGTCRFRSLQDKQIKSTCSPEADQRGSGQRVVSFVIYGDVKKGGYTKGIEANLLLMKQFYPGYVMRLYYDVHNKDVESMKILCDLFCKYPQLDLCDSHNIHPYGDISDSFGMIWRFAPMADPLVEEWHSRDLDSLISDREAQAVQDWRLNTNKSYHVMRDHPYHVSAILGGMFGMRLNENNREMMSSIFTRLQKKTAGSWRKNLDQLLLVKYLKPAFEDDLVAHDSYLCGRYEDLQLHRPFPSKRISSRTFLEGEKYNFVGSNGGSISLSVGQCPKECRPAQHMDWKLC